MDSTLILPITDTLPITRKPICIVSHPRSGTHLTIDFLRRNFPQTTRWKYPFQDSRVLILDSGQIWKKETTFEKAFQRLKEIPFPIVKMYSYDYELLKEEHKDWIDWINEEAHIFYIVRNVKDMLCSYHEYIKTFWEPARVPIKKFIRQNEALANLPFTSRVKYWSDEVVSWVERPGVHVVKYEDLLARPLEHIHRISDILEVPPSIKRPLLPPKIENKWLDYFQRYLSILPVSTAIVIETKTPKWYEVFDQEDLQYIRTEAEEALKLLEYTV